MNNRLKLEEISIELPLLVIPDIVKLLVISYFLIYNSAKNKY